MPAVRAAFVTGVPDATFGELVGALVVLSPGGPAPDALVAELRRTLAKHKLPRRLVVVAQLPVLPSGKIDRRAALSLFGQAVQKR